MSVIDVLKKNFPQAVLDCHSELGNETVFISRDQIHEVLVFLKKYDQSPFNLMLDICGVDYINEDPRFEVVYHLYSLPAKTRLRIRVKIPENDLKIKSAIDVWQAADWFEREAYEMYGIIFEGHPNLKRLLTWEGFEGYPQRKDYPIDKRQPIPEPIDIV